jgi:hypothetical protein
MKFFFISICLILISCAKNPQPEFSDLISVDTISLLHLPIEDVKVKEVGFSAAVESIKRQFLAVYPQLSFPEIEYSKEGWDTLRDMRYEFGPVNSTLFNALNAVCGLSPGVDAPRIAENRILFRFVEMEGPIIRSYVLTDEWYKAVERKIRLVRSNEWTKGKDFSEPMLRVNKIVAVQSGVQVLELEGNIKWHNSLNSFLTEQMYFRMFEE